MNDKEPTRGSHVGLGQERRIGRFLPSVLAKLGGYPRPASPDIILKKRNSGPAQC